MFTRWKAMESLKIDLRGLAAKNRLAAIGGCPSNRVTKS
jgi:hypothetical protein